MGESEQPDEGPRGNVALRVRHLRKREALRAGLTTVDAILFAESDVDISDLRHLVDLHWPPDQIANMLLD